MSTQTATRGNTEKHFKDRVFSYQHLTDLGELFANGIAELKLHIEERPTTSKFRDFSDFVKENQKIELGHEAGAQGRLIERYNGLINEQYDLIRLIILENAGSSVWPRQTRTLLSYADLAYGLIEELEWATTQPALRTA